ncbi:MAG: oligosaccharide flippase family protein [Acidobacteriota bacterium]
MSQHSFRSLFKDIAIYGFGDLTLRATSLVTLPIYTRIFSPADYGILSYVLTIINIISAVSILGCNSAYSLYFFEAETVEAKQIVTSTSLGFISLLSLAVALLFLPFASPISFWSFGTGQHALLFSLAFLSVPAGLINSMCGQVLRNQFQARLFTTLNIITAVLTVGFGLYGVVVMKLGLVGVVGGGLVAACIMLPARFWTIRAWLRPVFAYPMLKKLLAFGVPLVPMTIAYWVFEVSDRIILSKLSTLEQLGLYAVANTLTGALALVNSALGQAWSPHAFRMRTEHPDTAPQFFGHVLTYILVSFGILCVGITVFAREILVSLSSPRFYPAALAIGPLALGFVAYASTQVTAAGLSLAKKTSYLALFAWIAALLNIGLNIIFVPRWGMMAAAWSTAVSYIFLTVAYMISAQRFWRVSYEKYRAATVALLTFVCTAGVLLLPSTDFIPGLLMKTAYCLVYVALLFVFQVLDRRELKGLLALWRGVRVRVLRQQS